MRILFYTPLNEGCRDIESQAIEFKKRNHQIFLLTQSPRFLLHKKFESYGFSTASSFKAWARWHFQFVQQLFFLVGFCWRNKIDLVYAHLEPANFIAVLAQFVVRTRVIICRHHMDYARLIGFDKSLAYRLTYTLARTIIVVSGQAREYMIKEEGIQERKIRAIRLSYNFDLYNLPLPENIKLIKDSYPAEVLLLTVCRLTKTKRAETSIRLISALRKSGLDAKLIILGKGEMLPKLKREIASLQLQESVFLVGHVSNVLEYMAAATYLVHPSISESSCISTKEAGLVNLPVIVCKGIGDFDDVMLHEQNAFVVSKNSFVEESSAIIHKWTKRQSELLTIGNRLRLTIHEKYDIKNVAQQYEKLFHTGR